MSELSQPEPEEMPETPVEAAPRPVPELTRTAIAVLAAAIVLGVLGDRLLDVKAWGLNVTLWLAALAGAGVLIVKLRRLALPTGARWLLAPVLGFAAAFAWRDAELLRGLALFSVGVALTVPAWRAVAGRLRQLRLREIEVGMVLTGVDAAVGAIPLLVNDIQWGTLRQGGGTRHVMGLLWGLAIALPLVLLFGTLFASADAGFEKLVTSIFRFDLEQVISHTFLAGMIAWFTAGYLRGVIAQPETAPLGARELPFRLGVIEVATVLVLLDALFAVFVTMQLPYFFGGTQAVQTTADLTYAEYARRGFFELVTVTALVLPLLLVLHALLGERNPRHALVYRVLAGVMIALVAVIVASAAHRMWVYQSTYGLTVLRVHVLAFEAWLAVALVWFAATVLRQRSDRFAFGLVVWGWVGVAALHLPNIEAMIVRHNVAMAKAVDAAYFGELSADAVPAVVDVALGQQLPPPVRAALAKRMLERYGRETVSDWRSWHWAQARARAIVGEKKQALEAVRAAATPADLWPEYSR